MRARNVFLAILIIIGGMTLTAYHKGSFTKWEHSGKAWGSFIAEMSDLFSDANSNWGEWHEVNREDMSFETENISSLIIYNPNGNTTVLSDADKCTVEIIRYGKGSTPEEQTANSSKAAFNFTSKNAPLTLNVSGPKHFMSVARIDLVVKLPADIAANVRTISGNVDISGRQEKLEINSISGDVSLKDCAASTRAVSVSGDLLLANLDSDTYAKSVSGNILLDNVIKCEANSVSGDIRFAISEPFENNLTANSISGDIYVSLPLESSASVNIKSISGDMRCDFPLLEGFSRSNQHLNGKIGEAKGRITLSSTSGSIAIVAAPKIEVDAATVSE